MTDAARYETALYAIRNAAGSASQFTNRLQFIYERANCALAGEEWDEKWRAKYGFHVRERTMRRNEELEDTLRLVLEAEANGGHLQDGLTIREIIEAVVLK